MNKKAQGLSINVIIIVAIALIVLVVLIAIFTGRLGSFVGGLEGVTTCETSCGALGMDITKVDGEDTKEACVSIDRSRYLAGTYKDITTDNVCCCKPK